MNDEGVQAILHAAHKPMVVKVHGIERLLMPDSEGSYDLATVGLGPEFQPDRLQLSTLSGIVAFIAANRDKLNLGEMVLTVDDHSTVSLRGKLFGEFRQRFVHAVAKLPEMVTFPFGDYIGHEQFVVGIQALFVPNDARKRVLEVVSQIKDNQVAISEDDGVSQTISATSGVTMKRRADVPNPVELQPFRTFREIEQPASPFVLRLKGGHGELPTLALFEADGGAWKLKARDLIVEFLEKALKSSEPRPVVIA